MERQLLAEGGIVDYDSTFLPKQEADILLDFLKANVTWEQKFYNAYGKQIAQPRLTAWYADDPGMKYSYSGVTQAVQPWLPELIELKKKIEAVTGWQYNSVLINFYRDGSDSVYMLTMKKNWARIPTSLLSRWVRFVPSNWLEGTLQLNMNWHTEVYSS